MTETFTELLYVKVTVIDAKEDNIHGTVAIEYTQGAGLAWAIALLASVVESYTPQGGDDSET